MRRGLADAAGAGPARLTRAAAALLLGAAAGAAAGQELRNWFDDPFVRLVSAAADCPEPAGPRVTEAERRAQAHRRAEKGTTCWLAGEPGCERPSAYTYDRALAQRIEAAWRAAPPVDGATLWLTVQGRVAYVEGCVAQVDDALRIEGFLRAVPGLQQAMAIVTPDSRVSLPYRALPRSCGTDAECRMPTPSPIR